MNIALIGYGGMGQAVGRIAAERDHTVKAIIDPGHEDSSHKELSVEALEDCDIAIDFSGAQSVMGNVRICKEAGVALVEGSTGWYDDMAEIEKVAEGGSMLWSSNFSIGVNLYFKMIENASQLINGFDEYDVWGHEIHHNKKADSPSGTAKTIEDILLRNIDRKTSVVEDKLDRRREDNEIHFSSLRGGQVNFEHTIGFDSAADTIKISHSARNRDGYALGAVKAAEWLKGKTGFFSMNDFLNL